MIETIITTVYIYIYIYISVMLRKTVSSNVYEEKAACEIYRILST